MKKITGILFAFLLLVSVSGVQAQSLDFGIKGGLSFATHRGDDVVEDPDMIVGFHIGGFANFSILDLVQFEPGIYYSIKGATQETVLPNAGTRELTMRTSFLDIPLLAKFSPAPIINVFIGPQPSILLNNKFTIKLNGEEETESDTEGLRSFDLALVLGAGVDLPMGLTASIGYDLGLLTIDEDGDIKGYNRVFKISVGYRF